MEKLYKYKEEFSQWDSERIRNIYNKLVNGDVCTFHLISLESNDQIIKEIQRVKINLKKSEHFSFYQESLTQYVLYFWEDIECILTIDNTKDELKQFENWFKNLLYTDCDEQGFRIEDVDHFVLEWSELPEKEYLKIWDLLEEEELN